MAIYDLIWFDDLSRGHVILSANYSCEAPLGKRKPLDGHTFGNKTELEEEEEEEEEEEGGGGRGGGGGGGGD